MCPPTLFPRTFKRNWTFSRIFFKTDGLIRLRSRLILFLRSSIYSIGVACTFSFMCLPRKKLHVAKSGERSGHPTFPPLPTHFRTPRCTNSAQHERNNERKHHPGESFSPLFQMKSGEMHNEFACFGSFHRSRFRLRKNKVVQPFLSKLDTKPL